MKKGTKVRFEAATEDTLVKIKQSLGLSDSTVRIMTRDGEVWTYVLHVASKMVRDLVQDRGCCAGASTPLLILPDAEKRTVALLDRILQHGSSFITLEELADIKRTTQKLNDVAPDLGFDLDNFQLMPIPPGASVTETGTATTSQEEDRVVQLNQ